MHGCPSWSVHATSTASSCSQSYSFLPSCPYKIAALLPLIGHCAGDWGCGSHPSGVAGRHCQCICHVTSLMAQCNNTLLVTVVATEFSLNCLLSPPQSSRDAPRSLLPLHCTALHCIPGPCFCCTAPSATLHTLATLPPCCLPVTTLCCPQPLVLLAQIMQLYHICNCKELVK